jgi:hypothetical protein
LEKDDDKEGDLRCGNGDLEEDDESDLRSCGDLRCGDLRCGDDDESDLRCNVSIPFSFSIFIFYKLYIKFFTSLKM